MTPTVENLPTPQLLDREALIGALESTDGQKFGRFLSALSSERYKTWSVGTLARKFGITANELATLWRNNQMTKAMFTIIEGLPRTAAAVVEDAQPVDVVCPTCKGFRIVEVPFHLQEIAGMKHTTCSNCGGTGKVRRPGSDADRKRMWQAAGWNKSPDERPNTHTEPYTAGSVIDELEKSGRY